MGKCVISKKKRWYNLFVTFFCQNKLILFKGIMLCHHLSCYSYIVHIVITKFIYMFTRLPHYFSILKEPLALLISRDQPDNRKLKYKFIYGVSYLDLNLVTKTWIWNFIYYNWNHILLQDMWFWYLVKDNISHFNAQNAIIR